MRNGGGNDPDWFTAHISRAWPDEPLAGMIVAGSGDGPDGPQLLVIANPYDQLRDGTAGFDGIPRPIQSPDATKIWFHSSMMMPDNTHTGSFTVVSRRPHAPQSLQGEGEQLVWTPHAVSSETKNWIVYRKHGDDWGVVTHLPKEQTSMDMSDAEPGVYMVTALEWSGLESDETSPTFDTRDGALGPPVKNWDTTAPEAPATLEVIFEKNGQYRLAWEPSPDEDVRYYNLYASQTGNPEAIQRMRFASVPAGTISYLDWLAPLDGEVYYAITAVDRQGNESQPRLVPEPSVGPRRP